MPVAVVTDSTSDIEPRRASELGITVVPLFVIWGDRSYRDYVDLSRREFYAKLAGEPELPKTSQPTARMFEEAFAPLAAAGREIVCVVISSKLSGTINAATAAAAHFPEARIVVFDSESVAGGLGMQARVANDLARAGASLEEIVAGLERERRVQRLYACLPDLSHVVRTGRIGKARAAIGTLMKIVSVLSLKDGEIVAEAQVRTFARAQAAMIELALRNVTDISAARFLVMHTNASELAESVRARLESAFGGVRPKMLEVLEAGPVIATHGGPGAVGVFSAQ
ncbi:MAG TPA: DegV family protein [Candidatus Rubrimentiphilum sp.]|nr:DegV family protein [Candidatus Rubrimentiphilum sp.]